MLLFLKFDEFCCKTGKFNLKSPIPTIFQNWNLCFQIHVKINVLSIMPEYCVQTYFRVTGTSDAMNFYHIEHNQT